MRITWNDMYIIDIKVKKQDARCFTKVETLDFLKHELEPIVFCYFRTVKDMGNYPMLTKKLQNIWQGLYHQLKENKNEGNN